jgi:hypothetical protein
MSAFLRGFAMRGDAFLGLQLALDLAFAGTELQVDRKTQK